MKRTHDKSMQFISPVIIISIVFFALTPAVFAINPQPEPPGSATAAPALRTSPAVDALGPQPEPPDKPNPKTKKLSPRPAPLDIADPGGKALGPQPEPPDMQRKIQVDRNTR